MININEILADFYLVGCSIRNLEINNNLILLTGKEKMQLGIGVEPVYQGVNEGKHSGNVSMQIDISAEKKDDPSKKANVAVTIEGIFNAPAEMEKDQFVQMLSINGAAALYSIARGKIEAITSNSFANGKIEIPIVNFISYYNQDK